MLLPLLLTLLLGCAVPPGGLATTGAVTTVKTYENDTVILPCHVEDLGLQTRVRWWRGKELLADSEDPSATSQRVKMWSNRSLELGRVRPEDSGEYVCQASRPEPWGHVTQVHQIQVMYPASARPVPESGEVEVSLGEEAVMSCETSGIPKPSVTWSFEGEELPIVGPSAKLRIAATNRSLAGLYTCTASNGVEEPAQANIQLKIRHTPEVRARPSWVHSAPGLRAQLDCYVVAWPAARVEWYLEGEQLPRGGRLVRYKQDADGGGQRHSLVLRSVHQLGTFTCQATNPLGSANASVELSGQPNTPQLRRQPHLHRSSVGFVWELDSYSPIVQYQFWFRQLDSEEQWHRLVVPSQSEPIGQLHARAFNLTGLEPGQRYEALVLARNKYGWSSPSNILRFTTGNLSSEEEIYKMDSTGHEEISSVVQVTSDSHRSSAGANSSGNLSAAPLLLLLLLLLSLFRRVQPILADTPRLVTSPT